MTTKPDRSIVAEPAAGTGDGGRGGAPMTPMRAPIGRGMR